MPTTRRANVFTDPNGVRPSYTWEINHTSEDASGKHRNVRFSAPTSGLGLVKQVADTSPATLHWKGSMLTRAQLVETWAWFALCDYQTIYLTDFAGDSYEVVMDLFDPVRVGVARNMRDPTNAPLWKWEYTMQFTIVQIFAGTLYDGGVIP